MRPGIELSSHLPHTTVSAVGVSSDSVLLSGCRSDSGVVNVYESSDLFAGRKPSTSSSSSSSSSSSAAAAAAGLDTVRQPLKAIVNLTTPIHQIAFNYDSQLMAICSNRKKDALRMVHVPTLTTFSNWPTGQTPLRSVSSFAFSPHSGLFAIGNDHGRVLLYRINHYTTS
jgi:U3 small nucleolar RNA-associated protein 18